MIDGVTSKPFSAISLPPQDKGTFHKTEITNLSRNRYERKGGRCEKEILFKDDIKTKSKTESVKYFV